jgi:hypothetical protein
MTLVTSGLGRSATAAYTLNGVGVGLGRSPLQCDCSLTSFALARTCSRSSLVGAGAIHDSGRRAIQQPGSQIRRVVLDPAVLKGLDYPTGEPVHAGPSRV